MAFKIALTQYEQDTLENGTLHNAGKYCVWMAETKAERDSIMKLNRLGLINIRSVTYAKSGASAYLYMLTKKGDVVMRANWKDDDGG